MPFDVAYEPGFEDLEHRVPDTSAVNEVIGWRTERSIDDAVEAVIEYFRRIPTEFPSHPRSLSDAP